MRSIQDVRSTRPGFNGYRRTSVGWVLAGAVLKAIHVIRPSCENMQELIMVLRGPPRVPVREGLRMRFPDGQTDQKEIVSI